MKTLLREKFLCLPRPLLLLAGMAVLMFMHSCDELDDSDIEIDVQIEVEPEEPKVGDEVVVDASGSSISGNGEAEATYTWTLETPDGSGAELEDPSSVETSFVADEDGNYDISVTIEVDGFEESSTVSVLVGEADPIQEISSDITADATWIPEHLYRVTTTVDIEDGAMLTIEPGVTVEFESGAGLRVDDDASALIAEGTEEDRITMTGVQHNAGFWRGIGFESDNANNVLSYVTIEYAGGDDWFSPDEPAAIQMDDDARLRLTHSEITHSEAYGLWANRDTDLSGFSMNMFEDNDIPVGIPTTQMGEIDSESSFIGNNEDYVHVHSRDISDDMDIAPLNVPYRMQGRPDIEGNTTVTIQAGVEMEFESNAGLRVDDDAAALIADGTAAEPIHMTGVQHNPGFWRGIGFESDNAANELNYVIIEYAGGDDWFGPDEPAAIQMDDDARLTLTNSEITHSEAYGLWANRDTDLSGFSNNSFEGNDFPLGIPTTQMGEMDAGSSFTGNDEDYVLVHSRDVSDDMDITALDVPYRIQGRPDIEGNTTVTIEAGVEMAFESDAGLRVDDDAAALIADGNQGEEIVMTGVQKQQGFWRGIGFESNNAQNLLNYVRIEYGGNDDWFGPDEAANIQLDDDAQLELTNCDITDSGGYGAWANDGTAADITFSGNTYSNNAQGDNNFGDD